MNPSGTGNNLNGIAIALTSAFGLTPDLPGEAGLAYNALNSYGSTLVSGRSGVSADPKAFVTILVFDANYNLVASNTTWQQINSTAAQVGATKTPHQYLTKEMTITQPGHAYIFLSNENPTLADVYFDDLTLTHTQSSTVAGADYYPFGLVMVDREITDENYRYGYQGQFSEEQGETGWNSFELRMYDPRFGRWISPDPYGQYASPYIGMGNIPHMGTDPDGGLCCGGLMPLVAYTPGLVDMVVEATLASTGVTILNTVTTVGSRLGVTAGRTLAFLTGVVNAVNSNESLGAMPMGDGSTSAYPNDFKNGQYAGNFVSLAAGFFQTYTGVSLTIGGGAATVTGKGAIVGVPAMGVGITMAGHGAFVFSNSWNNMKRVHYSQGSNAKIPWSSKDLEKQAQQLSKGAKEITVKNKSEAEEIFLNLYQGKGYKNTSDFTTKDMKDKFMFPEGKRGTYHWDMLDTQHGGRSHLQIHDFDGSIIRIFY